MVPPDWEWMDTYCNDSPLSTPPNFDKVTGPSAEAFACETPEEFFRLLFPDKLVEDIMENTNLYASRKGVPIVFTKDDILGFIGLNIAMGIHSLPAVRDYWAREPLLRSPWFSTVMPRDKFMAISCFLHFTDNSKALSRDDPHYDRLWKIRPVIQKIQEQSQKMYTPGEKVSIDESMIGTKARLSFLQYMPKKPTKWGVKVSVLSEAKTGYIYKFDIYTGKGETSEKGLAYVVVLCLMEELLDSGRVLYCDNFYTSPTFLKICTNMVYMLVELYEPTKNIFHPSLLMTKLKRVMPRSNIMELLQLESGLMSEMCTSFQPFTAVNWKILNDEGQVVQEKR